LVKTLGYFCIKYFWVAEIQIGDIVLISENLFDIKIINEAPRRKRAGYQNGIKINLDDGGKRSFPPHPPPHVCSTASGGGIKNLNQSI